jgi:hypothetical protein
MDVERIVAKRLMDATGIKAVLEVPAERPAEFISVEIDNGSGNRFIRDASLSVQSWAKTRRRAAEMASLVEKAVPDLVDEQNIFRAVAEGSYRWPDPDSGQARYQTNVELTICE